MTEPSARERLLVAATGLFAARGIAVVTVDDILERAGVAIPTLYRQFKGGKPRLVAATLAWWSQAHLERMQAALQSAQDPQQRLEQLIAVLAKWFSQKDYRGSYVTNAAADVTALSEVTTSPEARAAFRDARTAITEHRQAERALLVELTRYAGAADPEGLADQLHVVLDGAVEGAKLASPDRRPAIVEATRAIALGLLKQSTAAANLSAQP